MACCIGKGERMAPLKRGRRAAVWGACGLLANA